MVEQLEIVIIFHLILSIQVQTLDIDHWGTHFVFSFPRNLAIDDRNIVMITARERADVVVTLQQTNTQTEFTLNAGESRSITYGSSVLARPYHEVLERRAISVVSSAKVSVYGFSSGLRSSDGFLAIPVPALGTYYMAITATGGRPQIVVVGVENGTTVSASISGSSYCLHLVNGWMTVTDENYEFTLNEYDVFCFYCFTHLTGSIIKSDKPIAVLSGNKCTQIPEEAYCDYVVEMLPSTSNWGTDFVLTAPIGHSYDAMLTILALKNNTVVNLNSTSYTLTARQFTSINVAKGSTFCLTSNQEILVTIFMTGADNSTVTSYYGDAYLDIVSPIDKLTNEYLIDIVNGDSVTYYVIIISTKEDSNSIYPTVSGFQDVCNMAYKIQTFTEKTKFTSTSNFLLSVYGFGNREGFGYPAGRKFVDFSDLNVLSEPCRGRADECSGVTCQNGGWCIEVGTSYRCHCLTRYTGAHCEIEITAIVNTAETSTSQDQSTTREPTTALTTTQETSTAPTTTQEPSTAPTTTQETSTAPTTTQETSKAPTTTQEPSTAPTTTQETSTAPTTTQESSTAPTTTQESSTAPTTTQEPSTAPTTTQETSTAPTTTQEPSTAQTTNQETSTAPTTIREPSTTTQESSTTGASSMTTTTREPSTTSRESSMTTITTRESSTAQAITQDSSTDQTREPSSYPVTTPVTSQESMTTSNSTVISTTKNATSHLIFKPIGYRSCKYYCMQCPCPCPNRDGTGLIANSVEYAKKEQLKLTLNKNSLSKKIRTKTSAPNIEMYEITIGITSVSIVIAIFTVIFMLDVPRVIDFAMGNRR